MHIKYVMQFKLGVFGETLYSNLEVAKKPILIELQCCTPTNMNQVTVKDNTFA